MVTNDPDSSAATLDELRRENELLRKSVQQSSSELEELRVSVQQSSSELELLRAERDEYLEQLKQRDRKIADLQHQVQTLLRRYFGRSSEKMDPRQRLLFENLIDQAFPELPAEDATAEESAARRRKGHGRRRLPADLPREKVIHDLPEDEKPCPCCGTPRHIIGKQTHEQLDYVPAKVKVIEHVRLTYGCPRCERDASPDGPQIVTAARPLQPIEKGLAAPGLLSYVIVSKYGDHLPLHRLERIFDRHGIEIARSTMCDWAEQSAEALRPLYDLMVDQVRASEVIHTDDTPVKVQDRSRTRTRTGRFWVYLGDHDHPYTVFAYTPSRSRDGPLEFLRGWGSDKRVYLQADAFGGYDGIYAGEAGGHVTEVACWAHARRKFYDARTSDPAGSAQALAQIKLLYAVEKQARQEAEKATRQAARSSAKRGVLCDTGAARAGESSDHVNPARVFTGACSGASSARRLHALLVEHRARLRQERAVPQLEQFRAWLQSQRAEHGGSVLPRSPLGQAIQYTLNQWDALCVYTTDGRLAIDNNAAENALRPVAVGRKNWLFAGSDNGGHTAATLFSLIATYQRHRVEPLAYLRDVLTRISAIPVSQLGTLLPDRWRPRRRGLIPRNNGADYGRSPCSVPNPDPDQRGSPDAYRPSANPRPFCVLEGCLPLQISRNNLSARWMHELQSVPKLVRAFKFR